MSQEEQQLEVEQEEDSFGPLLVVKLQVIHLHMSFAPSAGRASCTFIERVSTRHLYLFYQ
jgi:hypothetical protein